MEIKDYSRYTELMKNGYLDKLFFTDKIFEEWQILLDYGSADGFLTKRIAELYPDKKIVGYEPNLRLLDIARHTDSLPENVTFTKFKLDTPVDILNLSSVIHEVYAYESKEDIKDFWNYVFNTGFKIITIRDMFYNSLYESEIIYEIERVADIIKYWCKGNHSLGELTRFENIYGPLAIPKNAAHFLLKYLYISTENWERELKEDYLKLNYVQFKRLIPSNYEIFYEESYTLPYLKYKWRRDFKVNLNIKTHAKFILKCKKR